MGPKLKSIVPTGRQAPPPPPEEIVVGNIRVGKDGVHFTGGDELTSSPTFTKPSVQLDDLILRRPLGEGQQGTVCQYLSKNDRNVSYAVKKISIPSTTDYRQMQSVASELRNIFSQENEFTIKLHNAFYRNFHLYLIMEYMDWGSLEELCGSHAKLSEPIAAYIASQILHSLVILHQKQRVVADNTNTKETRQIHRDIKPANVLLGCDGRVKLADFGVAANAETIGASSFVGTATYMSPERIRGGKYGPLSDVWSVGVVVAQILKGEYPFSGAKQSFMALLREVTNFESLDTTSYGISSAAVHFINLCLRQKEEERVMASELLACEWIVDNAEIGKRELIELLKETGDIAQHRQKTVSSSFSEKSPLSDEKSE